MAAAPVPPAMSIPPSEPAPLSEGARIINTFIAPSKTFTDLRRSASWWAPWLLIAIFSVIFIFAVGKQVTFEQVTKNAIAHSSRADQFDKLPADQQASRIRLQTKIVGIFAYGSPFLLLFYCLLGTLALWLSFKLVLGGETTFGQAYAITMYGWLPGIIGAILGTISLFAGVNPEGFDINNPVGTNLAYYLDPETTGKFVRGMASSLDILSIWTIVLIGIGFSCTSKVKRSTAIIVVAVWYVVYKLAGSALGAL
jgi:Yip1 domain